MFFKVENGREFSAFKGNGKYYHVHNAVYPTMLRNNFPDNLISNFYRVAIVRDPILRFLSAFGNRVVAHQELSEAKMGHKLKGLGLAPDPDLDTFIDQLEGYSEASASIRHHTRPLVDFLGQDPAYFSRVYRMDELETFMADMNSRMGTDLARGKNQTGGPKISPAALNTSQERRLKLFYRDDFDRFGGYF